MSSVTKARRSVTTPDGSVMRESINITQRKQTVPDLVCVPAKKPDVCPPEPCPPPPCPPPPCPPEPCPPTPCPPEPCPPPPCPPEPCPPKKPVCPPKKSCWKPCADNAIWWTRGLIALFALFSVIVVGVLGNKYETSTYLTDNWMFMKSATAAFVLYVLAFIALTAAVFVWPESGMFAILATFVMLLMFFGGITAIYSPFSTGDSGSTWILVFSILVLVLLFVMLFMAWKKRCINSSLKFATSGLVVVAIIVDIVFLVNYARVVWAEHQA